MKIAYFLTHPIQYQSPLIRALRDAGVDVQVVYGPMAADWSGSDRELGRREPWDVPLDDGYPREVVESPFAFGPAGLLCLRPRIRRLLQRLRPGAVWIHGWGDVYSVAAWNVAWELGIPVLLRGESHLKCLKGGFIRRWLHRQVLSRCFGTVSRFLAIGSANRAFYRSYGVPAAKIVDVPYAVDNERFSQADATLEAEIAAWRRKLDLGDEGPVVGFFGKLKRAKRPDLVLRAVARCAAGLPPERRPWLLFVGDGPLRGPMEALAARLYPDRVRFLGFQNQSRLPVLYRLADLLLLPSDFEPWGLVVNEAMCAECPAVVSDRVGSAPDLVQGTGRVFPAGSLTGLADMLQELLAEPARLGAHPPMVLPRGCTGVQGGAAGPAEGHGSGGGRGRTLRGGGRLSGRASGVSNGGRRRGGGTAGAFLLLADQVPRAMGRSAGAVAVHSLRDAAGGGGAAAGTGERDPTAAAGPADR